MRRITASSILIVVLIFSGVWLFSRSPENGDNGAPQLRTEKGNAESIDESSAGGTADGAAEYAADNQSARAVTVSCNQRQLETLRQFNRENLQRLESSVLTPEAVSAYRNLSLADLESLAEQGDSLAMMTYGTHLLLVSTGRNPKLAVDYLAHQVPIAEITPIANAQPKNAVLFASMARNVFIEAAVRGRHAAFPFIGLTYEAQRKNAVDLQWISQEDYDALDDEQKNSLEPRVAYAQLAYMMDPNLLPAGSPNREKFDSRLERLGEHAAILDALESDFRQRLARSGRVFPTLPPLTYPDVDEEVIAACEEAGLSRWSD